MIDNKTPLINPNTNEQLLELRINELGKRLEFHSHPESHCNHCHSHLTKSETRRIESLKLSQMNEKK